MKQPTTGTDTKGLGSRAWPAAPVTPAGGALSPEGRSEGLSWPHTKAWGPRSTGTECLTLPSRSWPGPSGKAHDSLRGSGRTVPDTAQA